MLALRAKLQTGVFLARALIFSGFLFSRNVKVTTRSLPLRLFSSAAGEPKIHAETFAL
uniref:Uncharacterized protein n=1 Tax=Candidatus Kentrum sp. SD TaxID=2126332 RepID=A0A450YRQ9_9GAMM|nr:MAG: hypothetical protein BECKSD772F_GA0070984_10677 [Candidatus Kentron sp. SD]VFK44240.1 MAG: hypothetical protein BECKSD772E_GA0070983_103518 [Candidatus Kentron sp. SD]VFK79293.1 MAG: hypothetical protein BECKSD772D_GA0070982_104323 [Candidatus Kentron sp. SD]